MEVIVVLDKISIGGLVKTNPVWKIFKGTGEEDVDILKEYFF